MVRPANVARSRACQQCKRKRIRCDLHNPCHRCIESNLACSGPLSGPLIVNTSSSSFSQARSKNLRSQEYNFPAETQDNGFQPIPPVVLLPPSVYDEAFLWKFMHYFSQNTGSRAWNATMPRLVTAKNSVAMKAAMRAVSLAYAAQNIRDPWIERAACESYGSSLRYHQFSFKAPTGKNICKKKAVNALPVTVLLSYFEMIQATSPDAWLKHTLAAERLFALIGPSALNDELLNHLYFIIRANSAIRCLLFGAKTQLMEQNWSEVRLLQLCGDSSVVFHSLVDVILWLCNGVKITRLADGTALIPHNSQTLDRKLEDLITMWVIFGDTIGLDTTTHPLLNINPDTEPHNSSNSSENLIPSLPSSLQETSATLAGAFFHAAMILLLKALSITSTALSRSSPHNQTIPEKQDVETPTKFMNKREKISEMIFYHSSQILACTQHLQTSGVGCACVRMLLPVTVVYYLSPSRSQQTFAEASFRKWTITDGLSGVSLYALGDQNF